ncbi:hypothetical protein EWM64_g775 [Hericium alpestre]|uniref:DDB1- and CUL4-associated factor 13 n=1 Tax=Hericium alpestre TaxID=135208 RepID=A0A4Z0AB72_9AGAM|nr:hypothetical protein EWM64_g775 [Hericium alpestre]
MSGPGFVYKQQHQQGTRALNAAKMERMFAKPFVAALEGHVDAVEVLKRRPESVTDVVSGSWDGDIILHNLARRTHVARVTGAHKGKVSGLCFADEHRVLSCGVDRNVKMWDMRPASELDESMIAGPSEHLIVLKERARLQPYISHFYGVCSDRTFILYDIRTGKAERRVVMQMRANSLSWSPTFPTSILLGSEDHNLYTFDIRSLSTPTQIYKAHVAAVMSCDWSPTGTEFVSGGWDRTVRIWKEGQGTHPEVYHTKRMQRVLSTAFSADARFVLSGSDDGNVRVWKANASEKLGIVTARERAAIEYRESLKDRWKTDAQVGKVQRSRHIPKPVYKAGELKRTVVEAARVKEERRRKHTRAGESKPKAERKKVVIAEQS